ncbi:hypothetical protein [Helicobacter labacensis]|uniref:hypothetical protein n=1 Tax=Helicobacter labacensis TaxID=2316079 RepID=UPI001F36A89D|nr:hypothetical protein [Helicobacter labacensis]
MCEPAIGSVLWHDLADAFSHTGVYVGGGQIVHLTGKFNGSRIEKCTSQGFSEGKIIFVSCRGTRTVGDLDIGALSLVGQARDYHLFKPPRQKSHSSLAGGMNATNSWYNALIHSYLAQGVRKVTPLEI